MSLSSAIALRIGFAVSLLAVVIAGCSSNESGPAPEPVRYGALTGFVYLHGTPVPLADAVIEVGGRTDTTISSGKYFIDSIPHGTHTLTVTRDEYRDYSEQVTVSDTAWMDISMRIDIDVGDLHGFVMHPVYGPVTSAKVVVGNDSTFTNPDGLFMIPNIPVGEQLLRCSKASAGYHDFSQTVYISGSDNAFDITLVRTVHDSIPVIRDTYIESNSRFPENNTVNFGLEEVVAMLHWQDFDSTVNRRFLLVLPPQPNVVDFADIESATLVLREVDRNDLAADVNWVPQTIVIRRILQDWKENQVTGNTEPRVDADSFAVIRTAENGITTADVMNYYENPEQVPYGMRLAFREDEEDISAVRRIDFYSREAYYPPYYHGPFVEFVYTH